MAGPVKKYKIGGVFCNVWENNHPEYGKSYSFSPEKRYMDKDKQWKSTTSFKKNELASLIRCLQMAFDFAYIEAPAADAAQGTVSPAQAPKGDDY